MNELDFPEPTITITEARKRLGSLRLAHRQLISETKARLGDKWSKYLFRQLVQYGQRKIRQLELDL